MSSEDDAPPGDPRARSAQTKRDRTRSALLHAAQTSFGMHGWARTRMEDVAAAARVSAATAYNHFPTKHALIGHVCGPFVTALCAQAEQDLATDRPITDALVDQMAALAHTTSRHRRLFGAFLAACQEYADRVHAPPQRDDPADPRALAPLPEAVRLLVARGQQTGELRPYPSAEDISAMITTLLLVRTVEAPQEPPGDTTALLLTILLGTLHPELLPPPGADPGRRPASPPEPGNPTDTPQLG